MHLGRRQFLATSTKAIVGMGASATISGCSGFPFSKPSLVAGEASTAGQFSQPPLPYPESALQPVISAETVKLHYGKHHAGYFKKLNKLAAATEFATMDLEDVVVSTAYAEETQSLFNNAGQAWNHIIYWEQMTPGGSRTPTSDLAAAIDGAFGSFDTFKSTFVEEASGQFGSGWAWLVVDGGSLSITTTENADNPLPYGQIALIGIDVWEHAYYLDYQNRRKDHVTAVLDSLINWDVISGRLQGA